MDRVSKRDSSIERRLTWKTFLFRQALLWSHNFPTIFHTLFRQEILGDLYPKIRDSSFHFHFCWHDHPDDFIEVPNGPHISLASICLIYHIILWLTTLKQNSFSLQDQMSCLEPLCYARLLWHLINLHNYYIKKKN